MKASKPNYVYKSFILKNRSDMLDRINKARLYDFTMARFIETGEVNYCFKHREIYNESMDDIILECLCFDDSLYVDDKDDYYTYDFVNECNKILTANYKRAKRLKERISTFIYKGNCLFLTLTFTDDALGSTTESQRRVIVSRYLKKNSLAYVGNKDFGSKNGREHYHAVVLSDYVNPLDWKLGSVNIKRITRNNTSALSKYISKLTNHAIKETTKRSALIYSR